MRLLIHAYGVANEVADLLEERNKEACARHGIDYVRVEAPTDLYGRFKLILEQNTDVLYIDSDVLWKDTNVSLCDALGVDLSLTKAKNGLWHAGVIGMKNTEKSRDSLKRCIDTPLSNDPWHGSKTITASIGAANVLELSRKWNEWPLAVGPQESSVLKGFHGYPHAVKMREIKKELA